MSILPGLPSFFRPVKPKSFEYIPRYYDERKESRKERNAVIFQEITQSDHHVESAIKRRIRQAWQEKYEGKKKKFSTASSFVNLRLLIILVMLILFTYHILLK